ncbi:Uncharacterised protein [Vibrio cholerae]|nr:Uncharacterised protein [Vibrio cholerae]CSH92382.1 Uncharacterised protein [Vibrio cholerae]CSI38244.1 Uncharacterised protein [Vibrio cholerae]
MLKQSMKIHLVVHRKKNGLTLPLSHLNRKEIMTKQDQSYTNWSSS